MGTHRQAFWLTGMTSRMRQGFRHWAIYSVQGKAICLLTGFHLPQRVETIWFGHRKLLLKESHLEVPIYFIWLSLHSSWGWDEGETSPGHGSNGRQLWWCQLPARYNPLAPPLGCKLQFSSLQGRSEWHHQPGKVFDWTRNNPFFPPPIPATVLTCFTSILLHIALSEQQREQTWAIRAGEQQAGTATEVPLWTTTSFPSGLFASEKNLCFVLSLEG